MLLRTVCLALLLLGSAVAVDRHKFRTCDQTGFCKRHRRATSEPWMKVLENTVRVESGRLIADIRSDESGAPPLGFEMSLLDSGSVRVRVVERNPPRWESPDILIPGADKVALDGSIVDCGQVGLPPQVVVGGDKCFKRVLPSGSVVVAELKFNPFKVQVFVDGKAGIVVNERDLFYFEHRRDREGNTISGKGEAGLAEQEREVPTTSSEDHSSTPGREIVGYGEDGKAIYADGSTGDEDVGEHGRAASFTDGEGMFEEHFGSHKDTKPHGPMSVGTDISFPGAKALYGIPEHATTLALKPTTESHGAYSQPYRLYNLDVFEYELDETMALYGHIPMMIAHQEGLSVGVFWNNPTETFIDISHTDHNGVARQSSHWMSESGVVDLYLMPGPTPYEVFRQYTSITGTQSLPPLFALAYHQCRWNYNDEQDVFKVDSKFEEHNFPYDVLWLDIEHTDGKRYFTWDKALFPNPADMQNHLAKRGRKMVTIVDPHIKRDNNYPVHKEATEKGYYIKNRDGHDLDGWCWPGSSSYLDFTSAEVRSWWSDRFLQSNYEGSTVNLFTWNDMNEPSVFNGPEVSMDKDAKSIAGVEHREWHNLYGFYQQMATAEGQVRRSGATQSRPFVLSRAFYAGSQRHGAIWTGDNIAEWSHLKASAPMLMSIGLAGLSFAGADVGGFFKDPDAELMGRWYQAGAFQPFFRAHAHIDTKRREPWLFGDEWLSRFRETVRTRYTFLPLWYTLFYKAHTSGAPPMRPLWVEFPDDASTFTVDDAWMVGSELLVKPVTDHGARSVSVSFPGNGVWYDILTLQSYAAPSTHQVDAPLDIIPVYQRGGTIVPRKMRPRRCSTLMRNDPYTLVVALDQNQKAEGDLFLDDEESFNYQNGVFRLRHFEYSPEGTSHTLTSTLSAGDKSFVPLNRIERVVIVGLENSPKRIVASTTKDPEVILPL